MPRKAEGRYRKGPNGWSVQIWKTIGTDDNGKPIKARRWEALGTHSKDLAHDRGAKLIKAEADGRTAAEPETFEQAAERVMADRAATIATADGQLGWLRKHVFESIGTMLARDVERADLDAILKRMQRDAYAAESMKQVRKALVAVYDALKSEGALGKKSSPVPPVGELPRPLPEAIDTRPKAVLRDTELLVYLEYADPRGGESWRRAVRERQLMTLLSRCIGGMRTGEIQSLTWARAAADDGFDRVEVVRHKAKHDGKQSKVRQLYTLDGTVLPYFLCYWYRRHQHITGAAPALESVLFPVAREARDGDARIGERRKDSTSVAKALRRDIKRAFGLEVWNENPEPADAARVRKVEELARRKVPQRAIAAKLGMTQPAVARLLTGKASGRPRGSAGRWESAKSPNEYGRRLLELLEGTEDRKRLVFHSSRNAAALAAERAVRDAEAARATAHSPRMARHYREVAGEIDVVPVRADSIPDAARLLLILRDWCRLDGIDLRDVFGDGFEWPDGDGGKGYAKRLRDGKPPKTAETHSRPFQSVSNDFSALRAQNRPSKSTAGGSNPSGGAHFAGVSEKAAGTPPPGKGYAKRLRAREPSQTERNEVAALPPGAASARDLRAAIDAAILAGDGHLARRLNALACDLETREHRPADVLNLLTGVPATGAATPDTSKRGRHGKR